MLNKIKLYGRLARFIGERSFEAEVTTPAQAIRFLLANFPKLEKHMMEQNYCVKIGNYDIDSSELEHPVGKQEIKIIPVVTGSRGLTKFIIGAVIVGAVIATGGVGAIGLAGGTGFLGVAGNIGVYMALSGAAEMLTPVPKPPGVSDDPQSVNFSFNGVQNTGRAGAPIPVVYGEIFTGSLVVSAGIDTVQLEG
jgi:predicted phage tail protein|nr:phage tail assembly protein [uncultured Mediterranean phage uvMED]